MPPTTAEFLNALAPTWRAAVVAALLQGSLALAVVVLLWLALRKYLGNALAHGLFFLVPVKTVAAALFVAWPVVISFSITVPETVYSAIYPPQPAPVGAISELNPPAVAIEAAMPPSQEQWQALPPDFANPGPEAAFSEPFTTNYKTIVVTEAEKPSLGTAAWAMIAWAAACFVLIAFVCVRHMRLMRRMVLDALPPGADYQDKLNRLAAEMRLPCVPQLVESSAIATPAVVGLVCPRLVVPPGFFSTFDADQQRWILLHELAHIRRRDLWWLAFERLTGIAFFFHPALWISSRATRHFRELACDDLAQMQSGLSPRQCAETFLKLIMWTSRNPARPHPITPTLSLTDRYPAIQRRIMNMTDLNPQNRWTRPTKASFAALMATAMLISLPFSPKLVARTKTLKQPTKNEKFVDPVTSNEAIHQDSKQQRDSLVAVVDNSNQPPQTDNAATQKAIAKAEKRPDQAAPKLPASALATMKIGGFVVDSTDKPIEGVTARVYVSYPKGEGTRQSEQMKLESRPTDAQGRWSIDGVPANATGMHILLKHPTMIYGAKFDLPILKPFTSLQDGSIKMRMEPGCRLTLRVRDHANKALEGAAVYNDRVFWLENDPQPKPIGHTDAKGEFAIANEIPGTHKYIVTKPGHAPGLVTAEVDQNTPLQQVQLGLSRPISATLLDWNRKPMAGAEVMLGAFRDGGQVPGYRVKTDAKGHFEMKDLPWEPLVLEIHHERMRFEKPVNRGDMKLGTVQFGPVNELKFQVTDADSTKPLDKIATYLFQSEDNSTSTFSTLGWERNPQGEFKQVFYPAEDKKYTLLVLADGYKPYISEPIAFNDAHRLINLKVVMKRHEKMITYRGKAVQPDGQPAAGRIVRFTPINAGVTVGKNHFTWQLADVKEILTDANGGFEFQSPGQIQELLIVDDETFYHSNQMIQWNGDLKTFTLKPKPMITGTVTGKGKPVDGAYISLSQARLDQYIPLWNGLQGTTFTDSQGHYKLPCIYPGPVQVGVSIKTSRSSDRVYGIGRELKPGSEDVFNFELSDFIRN